jgi:hypothetical protein
MVTFTLGVRARSANGSTMIPRQIISTAQAAARAGDFTRRLEGAQ